MKNLLQLISCRTNYEWHLCYIQCIVVNWSKAELFGVRIQTIYAHSVLQYDYLT